MPAGRSLRSRASLIASSAPAPTTMSRPKRTTSTSNTNVNSSPVSVIRVPSPDTNKKSIRLNIKMPSSKLREATSGGAKEAPPAAPYSRFQPGPILSGPRGTRAKRAVVIESGSEDDEDEDEEEEEDDQEDAEDDDEAEEEEEVEDEAGNEEAGSDEDAEGEEEDVEGDEDAEGSSEEAEAGNGVDTPMEDAAAPPPPKIRMTGPSSKPSLTVTPAVDGKVKSVEAKEMQGSTSDDDEELSELESTNDVEEGEGGEEDAEGEEVGDEDQDMDQDQDQDDDDEDMDSDEDGTPADGSRASTPDVSKMTKRQRSRLDQVMGSDFLQLPMEPQIKKHLTAEEHAMRRAEMARRRKNLSEKRNEEEKMDTINRLLKKQAPKRRGKISAAEIAANAAGTGRGARGSGLKNGVAMSRAEGGSRTGEEGTPMEDEMEVEKANPVFVRWVSGRNGIKLGVPMEWEGVGAGAVFGSRGWTRPVEEVEG